MIDRVQGVAIVISIALLLMVLELVRRRKLIEEHSLLWIAGSLVLLALSVWRGFLDSAAALLGIYYPPSLVLMGLVLLIFVALLALSVILSGQQRRIESLTEESAVLAAEIRDLRSTSSEPTAQVVAGAAGDRRQPRRERAAPGPNGVSQIEGHDREPPAKRVHPSR